MCSSFCFLGCRLVLVTGVVADLGLFLDFGIFPDLGIGGLGGNCCLVYECVSTSHLVFQASQAVGSRGDVVFNTLCAVWNGRRTGNFCVLETSSQRRAGGRRGGRPGGHARGHARAMYHGGHA